VALNLPHRHAPRIHRHDLVVEAGKAPLIALDQLRIERPVPVARDADVDLRRLRQDRLLRRAVAPIARPLDGFRVEVIVQFGVQSAFRQGLLQFVEKPVLRKHGLRVAARQKII
jgi:hypothetical protein